MTLTGSSRCFLLPRRLSSRCAHHFSLPVRICGTAHRNCRHVVGQNIHGSIIRSSGTPKCMGQGLRFDILRRVGSLLPLCAGLPVPPSSPLGFPTGSMSQPWQPPLSHHRHQRPHRRHPCPLDHSHRVETSNGPEGPDLGRHLVWAKNMVKKIIVRQIRMTFQELTTRNTVWCSRLSPNSAYCIDS